MYGKVFGLPWKHFPFENKLQWESWQLHRRLLCENWISLSGAVGLGHREGCRTAPGKGSRLCGSADGEPHRLVSGGLLPPRRLAEQGFRNGFYSCFLSLGQRERAEEELELGLHS